MNKNIELTIEHYKETFGLEILDESEDGILNFSFVYPQPFKYFDVTWYAIDRKFGVYVDSNRLSLDEMIDFDKEYEQIKAIVSTLNYIIEK